MRTGRPKLGEDAKTAVFQIRFTKEQRKKLEEVAGAAGKESATWAREILLREIGETILTEDGGKVESGDIS